MNTLATPFRRALMTLALLALAAGPASAQIWTESGDAGETIGDAQTTLGKGPIQGISGELASATDVDIFCIRLDFIPPVNLSIVQLQCAQTLGPNVWLFNAAGLGIQTNSICSGGLKEIVYPGAMPQGVYYVAVSHSGYDPQSTGGAIWQPNLPGFRAPDGPGMAGALSGWAGTPSVGPINPYTLNIAGGFFSFCEGAVPARNASWGGLKIRYGM